jgi:hypothetical protein
MFLAVGSNAFTLWRGKFCISRDAKTMFTILIPSAGAAAAGDDVFFQPLSAVTACLMVASLNSIMHETDTLEDEANRRKLRSKFSTRGAG